MTMKYPSPLLGYNNNVRHKGKVFHIQTEDSGVKYGHIITHLFMDGGRILKSVKTTYSEYIGNERMADIVREMMKQQHKAMFIALRDGKFDPMADGTTEPSVMTKAVASENPPKPSTPPAPIEAPAPAVPAVEPPVAQVAAAPAAVPPPLPRAARTSATPPPVSAVAEVDAPATIRQPAPAELTLDIAALERAASAADANAPGLRVASDLPPPPANLFREKGATGKYRMTPVPPPTSVGGEQPPAAGRGPGGGKRAPTPAASSGPPGDRRYAPSRPAAIFGQTRPQQGKSIFGEDLISDKSLDEVILSYLAEDLDEKK
jgi:hypothetical protein